MGVDTLPQASQDIIAVQVWDNDIVINHIWAFAKARIANADALLTSYLAAQVTLNSHIEIPGSIEDGEISAIVVGEDETYEFPLPPAAPDIDYEVAPDITDNPPDTNAYYGTMARNGNMVIPHTSLLSGASDPEGETTYVSGVKEAVNCAVVNDPQGATVTVTPNSNFTGNATFIFIVADGQGNFTDETATIAVTA